MIRTFNRHGEELTINFKHVRMQPNSENYIIVGRDAHAKASTLCEIRKGPRGAFVDSFGLAYCSVDDNFSKEVGRRLALDRALERYDEETRGALNAAYDQRKSTSTKPC